ncbi:hypothetical protein K2Y11_15120 [bacterium]|nr:hypothetical protein [bacterium]
MAGQLQRLRDLMSEVQENHTDIQRLWKQIEAGGIVWPVGIAAAPPIEEMSSSSSQSSSSSETSSSSSSSSSSAIFHPCYDCDLPATLTLSLSNTYGGALDWWDGTFSVSYDPSEAVGIFTGCSVWVGSCITTSDSSYPDKKPYFYCCSGGAGVGFFDFTGFGCTGSKFFGAGISGTTSMICDPVYMTLSGAPQMGGTASAIITE